MSHNLQRKRKKKLIFLVCFQVWEYLLEKLILISFVLLMEHPETV